MKYLLRYTNQTFVIQFQERATEKAGMRETFLDAYQVIVCYRVVDQIFNICKSFKFERYVYAYIT